MLDSVGKLPRISEDGKSVVKTNTKGPVSFSVLRQNGVFLSYTLR